jgi:copper resistance protein B
MRHRLLLVIFVATLQGVAAQVPSSTPPKLYPRKDWPQPVEDEVRRTLILADILEYRASREGGDFRWDAEGWHGNDYNRIWFKSEGERNTALKADYDIDAQLLYGRFLKRYYDFQIGPRIETQTFQGRNVTRLHGALGIEGLVPYNYDIEALLFVSQNGDVSGRVTFTKDILLSQRLILQGRFETLLAAQRVERFTMGSGLNNLEGGLRLRYEARREFAPYVGVSFDRSFFGTADLVRAQGGDPAQIRFVAGIRFWQ